MSTQVLHDPQVETKNEGTTFESGELKNGFNSTDEDKSNLIINFLPLSMNEPALRSMFQPFGNIAQVKIVQDRQTKLSLGYGFVKFQEAQSALKAINVLNGFQLENKRIRVAISKPQREENKVNLYISGLPSNYTKVELAQLLAPFGVIVDSKVLFDPNTRQSRGVGFVRMDTHEHALLAIEGLKDKSIIEGSEQKLVVKFAEQKKNKPHYGFLYAAFGNRFSPMARYQEYRAASFNPTLYPQTFQPTYNNPYQPQTLQYNAASSTGQHSHTHTQNNNNFMGVCLFVYHLPPDATEQSVFALFTAYGTVCSVKIMKDLRTGQHKGFGFVNMLTMEQATLAIERLNGVQMGMKNLKVELKK